MKKTKLIAAVVAVMMICTILPLAATAKNAGLRSADTAVSSGVGSDDVNPSGSGDVTPSGDVNPSGSGDVTPSGDVNPSGSGDVTPSGDVNPSGSGDVTPSSGTTEEYIPGDANLDGQINTADAVVILKYKAEMVQLSEIQLKAADMNIDGQVNTADAVAVLRYVVGMDIEPGDTTPSDVTPSDVTPSDVSGSAN